MLDPQKTLECEALLKRYRELEAEIAQHERNLQEGEARLPIEEQLTLTLRRLIETNIPELPDKVWVEIRLRDKQISVISIKKSQRSPCALGFLSLIDLLATVMRIIQLHSERIPAVHRASKKTPLQR
jgi:hypothetical protein